MSDALEEGLAALARPCPRCGSAPGEQCKRYDGIHADRYPTPKSDHDCERDGHVTSKTTGICAWCGWHPDATPQKAERGQK